MSTIVTRSGKGSPLTHTEVDNNFTNLNTDKVETSGGTLTNPTINGTVTTTGLNFDSNTLVIDSTNNRVGVGVASPAAAIDVVSGGTNAVKIVGVGSQTLYSYGDSGGVGWATGAASSYTNMLYMDTTNNVRFYANSAERMRITSVGNVGIGTNGPSAYTNLTALTVNGTNGAVLDLKAGNTLYGELYALANELRVDAVGASGVLKLLTNSSERMRITSTGDVVVGSTSVLGGGKFSLISPLASANGVVVRDSSATYANNNNFVLLQNSAGSAIGGLTHPAVTSLGIWGITDTRFFNTNGATEVMRLDSSGNLGLGVTPSAWQSGFNALEGNSGSVVFRSSNNGLELWQNAYFSAGSSLYKTTAAASRYAQQSGSHVWYNAPSGTAGNAITFTQAMTLNASGNLGIGTTSPARRLDVSATGATPPFTTYNGGNTAAITSYAALAGLNLISYQSDAGSPFTKTSAIIANGDGTVPSVMQFWTKTSGDSSPTERMRIDSSGRLLVGGTSAVANSISSFGATQVLDSGGNIFAGSTESYAADKGGQIMMGGKYRGLGDYTAFGGFAAKKENGTDGNYAGYLQFLVSNNPSGNLERMRLTSAGALRIGTTAAVYSGTELVSMKATGANYTLGLEASTGVCLAMNMSGQSSGTLVRFDSSGSFRGSISTDGSTVSYNTSSDYRLKENIAPMTGALAIVGQLKPCTYTWKESGLDSQGFIAHELAEVVPECVTGEKDAVDAEGNPQYQGIDTSFLVATLTASIQELKAIVDAQAARIAVLESK